MTTTPASPSPRRRWLGLRFLFAFVLGLSLVAGVGGGALYAYGQQYTGRILPGVRVGGVDVSGLTPIAARQTLTAGFASLGAGRIVVDGPTGELTIGYGEIGRGPDVDTMLDEALAAGRRGEPVADLIGVPQAALRGADLSPAVRYDRAKLAAAVRAVAATIDETPVDARLVRAKDGTFRLTASHDGRGVDQAALLAAIEGRVGSLDAPAELRVTLPTTAILPAIDTADAAAARDAAERMATNLVIRHGKETWTITGKKLRALITFSPTVDGSIVPILDVGRLDPLIKKIAKSVDRKPKNATYLVSRAGSIVGVTAGHDGRTLDVKATKALVIDALMNRQAGDAETPVNAAIKTRKPALSTAEATRIAPKMQLISKWTTWFPIWSHNGFGANIWIPASLINGTVVGPGETFDFWNTVGSVTRAKGYELGGAIIDGHTQAQGAIGGGICSCSTTLFNAALRGGFKMGARKNHYYYIDRYPLGLDATVFISAGGGKQTMSWTNDTKYPVLIRGINTRANGLGYVTFKLYSVPSGRSVSISTPTVKNIRRAGDSVVHSDTLRAGYSQRMEYPTDGKDVWRTVTVKQNGKVIRKTTYYSHYSVITGIMLIGTGGASAPTSLP